MKPAFWARRAHKWIALVIGVQALLWSIGGLYMTAMSIDFIHGDHLNHVAVQPLPKQSTLIDPAVIAARYPAMNGFRLKQLFGESVYEVNHAGGVDLVDAGTGRLLGPIDEEKARQLALSTYQGDGLLESLQLLDKAPQEVGTRPVPMWQAKFGDSGNTALYFSPQTGELLATRHTYWRVFDFLWMLHIMDYEQRSDVNNTLLRVAASVGLLFMLSGVWLLFYSFRRRSAA
ncbi:MULTISPECIES: PepSY domain-containing protein [unclassified Lysobacter]